MGRRCYFSATGGVLAISGHREWLGANGPGVGKSRSGTKTTQAGAAILILTDRSTNRAHRYGLVPQPCPRVLRRANRILCTQARRCPPAIEVIIRANLVGKLHYPRRCSPQLASDPEAAPSRGLRCRARVVPPHRDEPLLGILANSGKHLSELRSGEKGIEK